MSGFVERVVEDWLTSSDERGYQLALAACLAREGHAIKHVSTHESLEHGKDIVSRAPEGHVYAYQLKAGEINKRRWREIRDEVREAAIVPVDIPGLPRGVPHRVFLVLTGRLSDPVRNEIGLLNGQHHERGWAEIEPIELSELVSRFTKAFETFFPSTLGPPSELVRLYLQDGRGPQNKAALSSIFRVLLPDSLSQRGAPRAAANVVVAAQFAAAPFRKAQNHIAEIDTWVLAACSILLLAKQKQVLRPRLNIALELCWAAIDEASSSLVSEAFSRSDFLEGDNELLDSIFLGFRRVLATGYMGAAINSKAILGQDARDESRQMLEIVKRERPMTTWGESAWNYVLNLAVALRHTPDGEQLAEALIHQWLEAACPRRQPYPKDPYWTLDDEFASVRGHATTNWHEQVRVSYSAPAAMGFLARRMLRQHLNRLWPTVSRYEHARLVPDQDWGYLEWECEHATLELHRQPITGSWRDLRKNAASQRSPLFANSDAKFLPFFMCTFPHRVDASLAGELDFRTAAPPFRKEWAHGT
jgi:hypothetical protein